MRGAAAQDHTKGQGRPAFPFRPFLFPGLTATTGLPSAYRTKVANFRRLPWLFRVVYTLKLDCGRRGLNLWDVRKSPFFNDPISALQFFADNFMIGGFFGPCSPVHLLIGLCVIVYHCLPLLLLSFDERPLGAPVLPTRPAP